MVYMQYSVLMFVIMLMCSVGSHGIHIVWWAILPGLAYSELCKLARLPRHSFAVTR